jgi:hypothetical protein
LPEFSLFVDHVVCQASSLLNLVNLELIVVISGGLMSSTTRVVGSSAPFGFMEREKPNVFEVSHAGDTGGESAAFASTCPMSE